MPSGCSRPSSVYSWFITSRPRCCCRAVQREEVDAVVVHAHLHRLLGGAVAGIGVGRPACCRHADRLAPGRECTTTPLLVRANQALQSLGDSPLPRLSALYDGVGRALASFPELLHYDGHGAESPVVGPVFVGRSWRHAALAGRRRRPARVRPCAPTTHPALPALLAALAQRGWPAIAYLHGGRLAPGQPGSTGSLRLETRPLHLGQVLRDADLVVSHAGIGTVSAALLAGKCQLLLPAQTEQRMLARRAAAGGLALALEHGSAGPADLGQALDRLRDDPALASTVGELARRYHGLTPERVAERLVDLLQAGVPPTAHGAGTAAGRPGPGRSGTH
jgi:UDP:flavonoid glycosyltransferase YjiC (YdhE family)